MGFLVLTVLLALALASAVTTLVTLGNDGFRQKPVDPTRR